MPDQADFHDFMNLRRAARHSGPPSDPCEDQCQKRASDLERARRGFFVVLLTAGAVYSLLAWWLTP